MASKCFQVYWSDLKMNEPAQNELFEEDIYDAARSVVKALGGAKRVGPKLFPHKAHDPAKAAEHLLNCLNHGRPEKLDLEQFLWLISEGRNKGCHILIQYIDKHSGYESTPINPEEKRAELQEQVIHSVEKFEALLSELKKLER